MLWNFLENSGCSYSNKQSHCSYLRTLISGFLIMLAFQKVYGNTEVSLGNTNYQQEYNSNQTERRYVVINKSDIIKEKIVFDNATYEIRYDFNLEGESLAMPDGCVLKFSGGRIINGKIIGRKTVIDAFPIEIFAPSLKIEGTWLINESYPEWFGAGSDNTTDDREAIQKAVNIADRIILGGDYYVVNAPFDFIPSKLPSDEMDYYETILKQRQIYKDKVCPIIVGSNKELILKGKIKSSSPLGDVLTISGSNSTIEGSGTIEGCGLVYSVNTYYGSSDYNWLPSLIHVIGNNNRIRGITIKNPVTCGIRISDYNSCNNEVSRCIIGGGALKHTQNVPNVTFTKLFGVYAQGQNNVISENRFEKINGRHVYDALFCDYSTEHVPSSLKNRTNLHTVFSNNIVKDVFEHAVYSYVSGLTIKNNQISGVEATNFQIFNGYNIIENNTINVYNVSSETKNHAMLISGENNVVRNNKIYGNTGYGIRCYGYYNGAADYCVIENNYIEHNLSGTVSLTDKRPYPAISVESTAFRDNKTTIDHITIRDNNIVCSGRAETRTVTRGIINVSGDNNTIFRNINIVNNSVVGSSINNELSIILQNQQRSGVINIRENSFISETVPASIKGDPSITIYKGNTINIERNSIEHKGVVGDLKYAGGVFDVQNSTVLNFRDNNCIARCNNNGQWFSKQNTNVGEITGNHVNDMADNLLVSVSPGKVLDDIELPVFGTYGKHFYIIIEPVNHPSKNSCNTISVDSVKMGKVKLRYAKSTSVNTIYRVKVVYL